MSRTNCTNCPSVDKGICKCISPYPTDSKSFPSLEMEPSVKTHVSRYEKMGLTDKEERLLENKGEEEKKKEVQEQQEQQEHKEREREGEKEGTMEPSLPLEPVIPNELIEEMYLWCKPLSAKVNQALEMVLFSPEERETDMEKTVETVETVHTAEIVDAAKTTETAETTEQPNKESNDPIMKRPRCLVNNKISIDWSRSDPCKEIKWDHLDYIDSLQLSREDHILTSTLQGIHTVLEPNLFPYDTSRDIEHWTLWSIHYLQTWEVEEYIDQWLALNAPHAIGWNYDDNATRSIDLFHMHIFIQIPEGCGLEKEQKQEEEKKEEEETEETTEATEVSTEKNGDLKQPIGYTFSKGNEYPFDTTQNATQTNVVLGKRSTYNGELPEISMERAKKSRKKEG